NQRQKYFLLGETSYQDINTHSQSHRILRIHIIQGARLVITGPVICASVITRSNLQNHLRKHCASGTASSTSGMFRRLRGSGVGVTAKRSGLSPGTRSRNICQPSLTRLWRGGRGTNGKKQPNKRTRITTIWRNVSFSKILSNICLRTYSLAQLTSYFACFLPA